MGPPCCVAPLWLSKFKSPFIEINIRNNSSSSDVLNIQASISISPSMNPNKRQQVIYCCSIAFIEIMLLQNTTLQQPSTSLIQSFKSQKLKRNSNSNAYGGHRLPMLSVPVRVPECPDSLLALLFMSQKLGLKLARNEWRCCPVLVNNPWRHSPSFT